MKERRRRARRGELVREIDSQIPDNGDNDMNNLVREIQDVATEEDKPACWICDNHPFNSLIQLRDHIEGSGDGGKSHMKMRKRWLEANQPSREQWLKLLADEKKDTKTSSTITRQKFCRVHRPTRRRNVRLQ